ncbi:hypothetical protein H4Q26_001084 [Puccinia striiformis f. sp. tritici PST-130]|nr:hypothetical protein H4Q26_001084 [Puccinia striiformis f. sp. tritici PST-130]
MNTFFGLAIVFLATWCSQLITAFDPQTEFECPKKQPHGLCGHQLSPDTNGNWTMTVLDPPDDNFPLQFNWCEDPKTTFCGDHIMRYIILSAEPSETIPDDAEFHKHCTEQKPGSWRSILGE